MLGLSASLISQHSDPVFNKHWFSAAVKSYASTQIEDGDIDNGGSLEFYYNITNLDLRSKHTLLLTAQVLASKAHRFKYDQSKLLVIFNVS